jgi:hypothetical protein
MKGASRVRRTTILLATGVLLLVTNAHAQSSKEQPKVANAHYGRDGFWHCDDGYAAGETGACEPVAKVWRSSTSFRLRELERSERRGDLAESR